MKIEINQDRDFILKEVYNGIMMETSEGNRIGICMRDDTFEINVMPKGTGKSQWFRVDMQNLEVVKDVADKEGEPQTCPRRGEGPGHGVKDEDRWTLRNWKFTEVEKAKAWNQAETKAKNESDAAKGYKGHSHCNERYYLWPGPGPMPRTCSYCGGLKPEDALKLRREFKFETEKINKSYKLYMHLPGHGIGMVNVMANMQAGVDPIESLKGKGVEEIYPPLKAYSMHFTEEQWKELRA